MKYTTYIIQILVIIMVLASCRKTDYLLEEQSVDDYEVITDLGSGTGTTTWTKDVKYLLDGIVFVGEDQVLTIEAGTVIRAKEGQGTNASALVVACGGKIIAKGTEEEPIIFTAQSDDLNGAIDIKTSGLWGGVIILGNAPINTETGTSRIEGIPIIDTRADFGGNNENDNSGILEYISIRHGGTNIGEDNEINGLTLGGVGRGTSINFIEVIANADDGVEIFGGNVDLKNIAVAYCDDDAFDYDLGYSGRGQFWFAIQDTKNGGAVCEISYGSYVASVLGFPEIYNSTFIGRGVNINSSILHFNKAGAGEFHNSIFMNQGKGVVISYSEHTKEGFYQWEKGLLKVEHSVFYTIGNNEVSDAIQAEGTESAELDKANAQLNEYFAIAGNSIEDPKISIVGDTASVIPDRTFNDLSAYPSEWFEKVGFKGAFGSNNWLLGWSLLAQKEIVK